SGIGAGGAAAQTLEGSQEVRREGRRLELGRELRRAGDDRRVGRTERGAQRRDRRLGDGPISQLGERTDLAFGARHLPALAASSGHPAVSDYPRSTRRTTVIPQPSSRLTDAGGGLIMPRARGSRWYSRARTRRTISSTRS